MQLEEEEEEDCEAGGETVGSQFQSQNDSLTRNTSQNQLMGLKRVNPHPAPASANTILWYSKNAALCKSTFELRKKSATKKY